MRLIPLILAASAATMSALDAAAVTTQLDASTAGDAAKAWVKAHGLALMTNSVPLSIAFPCDSLGARVGVEWFSWA